MDYSVYFKTMDPFLLCPLCSCVVGKEFIEGISVKHPACYAIGIWSKGYKSEEDWIKSCLENGKKIKEFYK
jgi:hypothetical protein